LEREGLPLESARGEIRRRDFSVRQSRRGEEKTIVAARQAHRDPVEEQLVEAELVEHAAAGRELDAQLPFPRLDRRHLSGSSSRVR
jgi:hypothetical protein